MNKKLKQKIVESSIIRYIENVPHISVDSVVFGFHDGSIKVLLLQLIGMDVWSIPGGYLRKAEDLDASAKRILEERTSVKNIFLKQFKSFGKCNRSEGFFGEFDEKLWHKQRFISVGFYALIDYKSTVPVPDEFSQDCKWQNIDNLPELMMDHREIVDEALLQLRRDLNDKPIGLNLLPDKFTMPELQRLYEVILGKGLNRGNFFRKMKRYDILIKLEETRKGGAHKSPDLYKFNEEKYNTALDSGLRESW